jgi:hypothetical protein
VECDNWEPLTRSLSRINTLVKRCVVATRCVKADLDGSLGFNLCACNVKLVTPKESVEIVTKGVEFGSLAYMPASLAMATAVPMGETLQVGGGIGR